MSRCLHFVASESSDRIQKERKSISEWREVEEFLDFNILSLNQVAVGIACHGVLDLFSILVQRPPTAVHLWVLSLFHSANSSRAFGDAHFTISILLVFIWYSLRFVYPRLLINSWQNWLPTGNIRYLCQRQRIRSQIRHHQQNDKTIRALSATTSTLTPAWLWPALD